MVRASVAAVFAVAVAMLAAEVAAAPPSGVAFVSTTGSDAAASFGCVMAQPCRSPSVGLTVATTAVIIQAGTYTLPTPLQLRSNIAVIGGADASWVMGDRALPAHKTILKATGTAPADAITATSISGATVMNLEIIAPDAVGNNGVNGRDSTAAYILSSSVTFANVHFRQGDGTAGLDGTDAGDAPQDTSLIAVSPSSGGAADGWSTLCNASDHGDGGDGGHIDFSACATRGGLCGTDGGDAGDGGTMDTGCGFSYDPDATSGEAGNAGQGNIVCSLTGGSAGPAGSTCAHAPEPASRHGSSKHGDGGVAASCTNSCGTIQSNRFVPTSAGDGLTGCGGSAGGGGGGSGGCDSGIDSHGAGGGGGGVGGQAAFEVGGAGGAGGSSFGIFACGSSSVTLSKCLFHIGRGGNGGHGGAGGVGMPGGLGGAGGIAYDGSGTGADGGNGGDGGDSGGGAGGNGGMAVAMFSCSSSATFSYVPSGSWAVAKSSGSPGVGGFGGSSINDGEDGRCGFPTALGTCMDADRTILCMFNNDASSSCTTQSACSASCPATAACINSACVCYDGSSPVGGVCNDVTACSEACQNGGRCRVDSTCACPAGFVGDQCETATCPYDCVEGECVGTVCECRQGWSGDDCSKADCPGCDNGRCIGPNNCECDEGYTGISCDNAAALSGLRTSERASAGGVIIVLGAAGVFFLVRRTKVSRADKSAVQEATRRPSKLDA